MAVFNFISVITRSGDYSAITMGSYTLEERLLSVFVLFNWRQAGISSQPHH